MEGAHRNGRHGHKTGKNCQPPPPEITEGKIRAALSQYGDIKAIQEESWSKAYRYVVVNDIRIVTITLMKHIPSHMTIAGHKVLTSYEGKPTCYDCGEMGHFYQAYPKRRGRGSVTPTEPTTTWTDIAASGKQRPEDEERRAEMVVENDRESRISEQTVVEGTAVQKISSNPQTLLQNTPTKMSDTWKATVPAAKSIPNIKPTQDR